MPAEVLLHRATTRVMSCTATVVAHGPGDHLDLDETVAVAVHRLHQLERRWSRFVPTSELSELNRAGGHARTVTPDTLRLVESMVRAWRATDGAFDPTLLVPIVGLGYAASRDGETLRTSLSADARTVGDVERIAIDRQEREVRLPCGTVIDPGGIGKGLAADIVAGEMLAAGCSGALVEIGGDVSIAGAAPMSGGWSVTIPSLDRPDADCVAHLDSGGVATSATRKRSWIHDGMRHHHLLDPASRTPTTGDVVACTVIASTGAWAETFTKVAFVRGVDAALAVYECRALAGAITTADGAVHTSSRWKGYTS